MLAFLPAENAETQAQNAETQANFCRNSRIFSKNSRIFPKLKNTKKRGKFNIKISEFCGYFRRKMLKIGVFKVFLAKLS